MIKKLSLNYSSLLKLNTTLAGLFVSVITTSSANALDCDVNNISTVAQAQNQNIIENQNSKLSVIGGEILVKLKPGVDSSLLRTSVNEDFRIKSSAFDMQPHPQKEQVGSLVYFVIGSRQSAPSSVESLRDATLEAKKTLEARSDVEWVQLNWSGFKPSEFVVPNDTCYKFQWHYWNNGPWSNNTMTSPGGINLPKAWQYQSGNKKTVVAVLDTGQVTNHLDINPSNFVIGRDFIDDDDDPTDDNSAGGWHGSHVAGTIGSLLSNNNDGLTSVAWNIKLQPVRVLDGGSGTFFDVVEGIKWAAGLTVPNLPVNSTPAKIINMSLGGNAKCTMQNFPAIIEAISDARKAGVLIVVAAGNSAADAADTTPAGCNGVFTVAALDGNGALAPYSNYGSRVQIGAPGGNTRVDVNNDGFPDGVLSTLKNSYAFYQGTSMAAPHVAGVAALLASSDESLTPLDIEVKLKNNALPAQCPANKPCGAGLLNADLFWSDK